MQHPKAKTTIPQHEQIPDTRTFINNELSGQIAWRQDMFKDLLNDRAFDTEQLMANLAGIVSLEQHHYLSDMACEFGRIQLNLVRFLISEPLTPNEKIAVIGQIEMLQDVAKEFMWLSSFGNIHME